MVTRMDVIMARISASGVICMVHYLQPMFFVCMFICPCIKRGRVSISRGMGLAQAPTTSYTMGAASGGSLERAMAPRRVSMASASRVSSFTYRVAKGSPAFK